jgi:hypothetical protein
MATVIGNRPRFGGPPPSLPLITKSFLLLFFKKAELALLSGATAPATRSQWGHIDKDRNKFSWMIFASSR